MIRYLKLLAENLMIAFYFRLSYKYSITDKSKFHIYSIIYFVSFSDVKIERKYFILSKYSSKDKCLKDVRNVAERGQWIENRNLERSIWAPGQIHSEGCVSTQHRTDVEVYILPQAWFDPIDIMNQECFS